MSVYASMCCSNDRLSGSFNKQVCRAANITAWKGQTMQKSKQCYRRCHGLLSLTLSNTEALFMCLVDDDRHSYNPNYPHARCLHSGAMLDIGLVIFGGCMTGGRSGGPCPSGDSWIYVVAEKRWYQLPNCATPRNYASMIVMPRGTSGEDRVLLYGGGEKTPRQTLSVSWHTANGWNKPADCWPPLTILRCACSSQNRPAIKSAYSTRLRKHGPYVRPQDLLRVKDTARRWQWMATALTCSAEIPQGISTTCEELQQILTRRHNRTRAATHCTSVFCICTARSWWSAGAYCCNWERLSHDISGTKAQCGFIYTGYFRYAMQPQYHLQLCNFKSTIWSPKIICFVDGSANAINMAFLTVPNVANVPQRHFFLTVKFEREHELWWKQAAIIRQ